MPDKKDTNDAITPYYSDYKRRFHKRFSRRKFISRATTYTAGLVSLCSSLIAGRSFGLKKQWDSSTPLSPSAPVEYIVVGSGAGGGPLAVNLAKAGHKVVLIEAGDDKGDDIASVPGFNPVVVEDPRVRWDYFVRHYANDARQRRDSKYVLEKDGVLYPRTGTLGGCTVHSAMITVCPNNSDWDNIAQITGDRSWSAENMRKYFERLEKCNYVDLPSRKANNPSRHGFKGWLSTELADPKMFLEDDKLRSILLSAVREAGLNESILDRFFQGELDPNDWSRIVQEIEGLYNIPISTQNGQRRGPRNLIRETAAALPNNLIVKTNTLVTRILFRGKTAIGVEYIEGAHLYRADPQANSNGPEPSLRKRMLACREVILSAGTFNSPQILKLSGIGPKNELRSHGIVPIVDLPGVGQNLQDRYEVGVITQLDSDFQVTQKCTPQNLSTDPCFSEWQQGKGIYTSNYTLVSNIRKSDRVRPVPDLFIFCAVAPFRGYYPGFSEPITRVKNQFTWAILKAHTRNCAGVVKLRSADPRDTPNINFHYFDEGNDTQGEDLASVVEGVEFVRRMNAHIGNISQGEVLPGPTVQSRDDIARFVKDEAWGHHASCTNKMGIRRDPMAVVDSNFCVHGTKNLRVVDASVFPRIPGYFILTAIYMISEKASDVILADCKRKGTSK
ncbi:MAG: GMC family oxidoreductase [Nostoc sp.]|uniref:GMC family oxidoreductase n=1 Tax=Nostoc sp. TaxID=1180 RepID=UPI002FF8E7D6